MKDWKGKYPPIGSLEPPVRLEAPMTTLPTVPITGGFRIADYLTEVRRQSFDADGAEVNARCPHGLDARACSECVEEWQPTKEKVTALIAPGLLGLAAAWKDGYRYLGPAEWRPFRDLPAELVSSDVAWGLKLAEADARIVELTAQLRGAEDAMHSIVKADDKSIWALQERVATLEAENADLARKLADAENGANDRFRHWRDQLWQIMQSGWVSREAIEDNVLSVDAAKGMGWVEDPCTGCWHRPGMKFHMAKWCYVDAPVSRETPPDPDAGLHRAVAVRGDGKPR